jgi:hypothetical protein
MNIIHIAALLGAVTTVSYAGWKAADFTGVRPIIKQEFSEYAQAQAETVEQQTELLKGLLEQQSAAQSQMATSLMELQFQTLTMKRKANALDWTEEQNRCRIAKRLDYVNVEGCDD